MDYDEDTTKTFWLTYLFLWQGVYARQKTCELQPNEPSSHDNFSHASSTKAKPGVTEWRLGVFRRAERCHSPSPVWGL